MRRSRIRLIVLFSLGIVSFDAGRLRAQVVVLDDGFESYALGPLGSQGGWTSLNGAGPGIVVVSSPVKTGVRALLVPLDQPTFPVPFSPTALFQLPAHSQEGRFEVDAMKQNAIHDYLTVGLREGPDAATSGAACDLYFSNNGEIRWWGAAYPFTPLTPPTAYNGGQWYRVRLDWHANSTADIYINGVQLGFGLPFAIARPSGVNWVRVSVGGSGDGPGSDIENTWFDNAKVTLFDYATPTAVPSWGRIKSLYR